MPSYWKHVNAVLREADIIIEVLDARQIDQSRNIEIENKVHQLGRQLLFVVNKCDLVPKEELEQKTKKLIPSVYISSTEKLGTTILRKKLLAMSKGKEIIVGVVGYPNVGKSSLINALSGRHAARTSPESSFTKGVQKIRVDSKIMLLDTPGVFPYREKDEAKMGKLGAIDYAKLKNPEVAALSLIEEDKERIEQVYDVHADDAEEMLEKIAVKYGKLVKKGLPDTEAAARIILKDWQIGILGKGLRKNQPKI